MPQTLAEVRSAFSWDETSLRYRGPGGRFVPQQAIKDALIQVADNGRREINSLARQLSQGQIGLSEWQTRMAAEVKSLHLAQYAAGRGGFDSMTQADYGRVGQKIRVQYEKLQGFANDVEAGRYDGKENGLANRADMYGNSGNASFEDGRRSGAEQEGFTEERRVLGEAEHCPDCLDYADEGWSDIGTLPPIGDSVCRTNCKCTFEFRNPDPKAASDEPTSPPNED